MEKWEEFYTSKLIDKIHEIEMENLNQLIKVCKNLDISFVLYGGSLLGAYKYKGFIPWDDDIDVALLRDDYEKLIRKGNAYLSKGFFIESPFNNKKLPYCYAKLRNQNSKLIEYANKDIDMHKGIYIDIYPIDNIPDNDSLYKKQFSRVRKFIKLYAWRQSWRLSCKPQNSKEYIKQFCKYFVSLLLKVLPSKFYMTKINQAMTMYNQVKTQRTSCLVSPNIDNFYNPLLPFRTIFFENKQMYAPQDLTGHLTRRYGNITELPPEEKRYGHIPYKVEVNDGY